MSKVTRLILAFLTMAAGVLFVVVAATSAQASPYGHPFKCTLVVRTKANGVTIATLRCSGKLPDGTVAKFQCRQSPVAKPCKGPALPPTSIVPSPSSTRTVSAAAAAAPATAAKVLVVLHSAPRVLGSFTPDANGVVNANLTIPAGFTGNHTVEARVVSSNDPASFAPVLTNKLAAQTTRVMLPITIGTNSVVTRAAPMPTSASDSDSWGEVAVVGVAALGVVMLLGGGLLVFAGRRRRVTI